MNSRSQIPSTPARSAKWRKQSALTYPSPVSSPASSLTDPYVSTPSDSAQSSPASSPLVSDISISAELREEHLANFWPPPWDPVAFEQSVNRSPDKPIPRPPNSFMLFRSHLLKYIIPKDMGKKQQKASRTAGKFWNDPRLPRQVKKAWEERAKVVRDWHKAKYPDYKFSPRKSVSRANKNDDESDADEQCHKDLISTYFDRASPIPRPSFKRKQPKSVRGVSRDSDYDDDDDDEYVPNTRMHARRRTSRRSTAHLSAPSTSKRSPSASPYGATRSLYPTPPISPRDSPSLRVSRLRELQGAIERELAVARAEEAAAGSPPALDLSSHAIPQLSYPFMPTFMAVPDFCAMQGLSNNMPYAPTPQYSLPAFDPFPGNMLGLDSPGDAFAPAADPRLSPLPQHCAIPDPALFDFQSLPEGALTPDTASASPAEPSPEDFMGAIFDFKKYQGA